MEVTRELPEGEEKPLDAEQLAQLVRQAIEEALDALRRLQVPQEKQHVNCLMDGKIKNVEVLVPAYGHEVVWQYFRDIWSFEKSLALTDYLWEHGAMKNTFSGPDPGKAQWAEWTLFQIVADPIRVALRQTAKEYLFDFGEVAPWTVDQDKLNQYIDDVVALYGKRSQLITAYCPLGGVELPSEGYQEIVSGIRLAKWTDREIGLFLERHGGDYLWDDFKAPWIRRNIAIVSFAIKWGQRIEQGTIEEQTQNCLDLLKWSLLLTKDQDIPVSEGTCILTCRLDRRGGRFRRDDNLACGNYSLNDSDIQHFRDLVKQYRSARETLNKPEDLDQALWHFGRACVAALPRDVLVESVMGLEALLIPGGGEARYRFGLHGAAILSNTVTSAEDLNKDLKIIYRLRSQAVHGEKVHEVVTFAPKSRKILAKAIGAIVDLTSGGSFVAQEGISRAVEKYV